jgi:hypothetical protein
MKSPVLFIVFNRPETTKQVFEAIRLAKPERLYVAADGPRKIRQGEADRCAEVRRIATDIDWPCKLSTLFRNENLGCKIGVSSAIDWFFDNEEEGIILEDDVLPVSTFFNYCDELLEMYRHDDRIGMISGCNLITSHYMPNESYFFSRINHIWGWASWRRVWQHYDVAMNSWPEWYSKKGLSNFSEGNKCFESYWHEKFELAFSGRVDTWDYQWTFTCWRLGALTALPCHNQTKNIGFGADATHTVEKMPKYVISSAPLSLAFPLIHPFEVHRNVDGDKLIDAEVFGISLVQMLRRWISRIPIVSVLWRKCKAVLNYEA